MLGGVSFIDLNLAVQRVRGDVWIWGGARRWKWSLALPHVGMVGRRRRSLSRPTSSSARSERRGIAARRRPVRPLRRERSKCRSGQIPRVVAVESLAGARLPREEPSRQSCAPRRWSGPGDFGANGRALMTRRCLFPSPARTVGGIADVGPVILAVVLFAR